MPFENILCPQFADFTRNETFDLYDGADFLFGEKIGGEEEREKRNESILKKDV
jgi:hypothetical protein